MTAEAVLFDLDDTLYPYPPCNEAGKQGAYEAALDRGYDLDREAFDALYREGRRETKRDTSGTAASHGRALYFKHALRERAGEPVPEDALALTEAYWSAYREAMAPFPDAEATLTELREAGVRVGITTNLTTRIQLTKLRTLGLSDHVDALVTSEEAGREKPGSVMFTLSLARLNCTPDEAIFVGDNPAADMAGANAVGLETVLFNETVALDAPARHRPDHSVDDLADVLEVAL